MTLRFGILGAAGIAPGALIDPARLRHDVAVTVVAARDRDRAHAFADTHGIPTVAADYAAVIAHPDVDVVYNPLPMHLHHRWTIAALRAGKHVLCEKPFAANATEAAEMVAVAGEVDRGLVEAFHWRFHPLADRMGEVVRSGRLGRLRHVGATFSVPITDRADIRWQWATAGGSLMDLGCYPVQWVRFLAAAENAGTEPVVTSADAVVEVPHVDSAMRAELAFPGGLTATVRCSMVPEGLERALVVEGDEGRMVVDNPLNPHLGHSLRVEDADGIHVETVAGRTTYDHQLAAVAAHIIQGAPVPTGGVDAVATMQVIDDIYRAAGLPPRGTPID